MSCHTSSAICDTVGTFKTPFLPQKKKQTEFNYLEIKIMGIEWIEITI